MCWLSNYAKYCFQSFLCFKEYKFALLSVSQQNLLRTKHSPLWWLVSWKPQILKCWKIRDVWKNNFGWVLGAGIQGQNKPWGSCRVWGLEVASCEKVRCQFYRWTEGLDEIVQTAMASFRLLYFQCQRVWVSLY